METDNIRSKVSRLLGVLIPTGKWEQYLESLDKEGIPNRKQMIGMILIICQSLENLENKYSAQQLEIEEVIGKFNDIKIPQPQPIISPVAGTTNIVPPVPPQPTATTSAPTGNASVTNMPTVTVAK